MGNLSEKEQQNALNEVRILASVRHNNVISYKEAFIDHEQKCLWYIPILPKCPNISLAPFLALI